MELTLNRNHLSCYDTVLDTTVLHEETMEMIVPDACPDILRIVDTAGTVCLKSKEAQEGRAEITGTVRCAVLYLPDGESGIRRIEVNIPFFCSADGRGIAAGCTVAAVPQIRTVETRSINPRKVLVRVDLAIRVQVFSPADVALCSEVECEESTALEQLKETHDTYLVACIQEKPFTFSDDLTIPGSRPEAEEILSSRVNLICAESKIIGTKLIFKGEAALRICYRAANGELATADFELPFSQIMEISDAGEDADCTLEIILTDISCAATGGEGRALSVSLGLLAEAVVREARAVELLSDIYGVSCDVTAEFQSYTFRRLIQQNSRRQTAREIVETGVVAKNVVDTRIGMGQITQAREENKLNLSAEAVITIIYVGEDGEIYTVSRQIALPCQLELPGDSTCSCRCGCVGEVYATPTASGIEVRFDADFQYIILSTRQVTGVSSVQRGEAVAKGDIPSIVLRIVGSERLWDIAKAYHTTMADISQANELDSGEELAGKLLLIPKKR